MLSTSIKSLLVFDTSQNHGVNSISHRKFSKFYASEWTYTTVRIISKQLLLERYMPGNHKKNKRLKLSQKLGDCTDVKHEVNTGDNPSYNRPPWRTFQAQKILVADQVREMLTDGIIHPTPWSFPVVMVKKNDSSDKPRFCVDFRELRKLYSRLM